VAIEEGDIDRAGQTLGGVAVPGSGGGWPVAVVRASIVADAKKEKGSCSHSN
jgi:hypothetical protein